MKWLFLVICFGAVNVGFAQTLQLHFDARHSLDPKHTSRNFTTLYFEYFKAQDSGRSFIKPSSFLLKLQADFTGRKNNIGQS